MDVVFSNETYVLLGFPSFPSFQFVSAPSWIANASKVQRKRKNFFQVIQSYTIKTCIIWSFQHFRVAHQIHITLGWIAIGVKFLEHIRSIYICALRLQGRNFHFAGFFFSHVRSSNSPIDFNIFLLHYEPFDYPYLQDHWAYS